MPKKPELTKEEQALREHLGAAIRVVSGERGCKPAELAAIAGIGLASQYRIEAGDATPDVLYLVKITRRLGISIDELLERAWGNKELLIGREGQQMQQSRTGGVTQFNMGKNARQVAGNVVIAKKRGD